MVYVSVFILCWTKLFSSIVYVLNFLFNFINLCYIYLMLTMYILMKKSNKINIF